jgi:alpha-L-arabinofuranosidase
MNKKIIFACAILVGIFIFQNCKQSPPPGAVIIDASKTGAPIEKYIYGQFTEHLGRCIYGGLWAEMLDDRKFYHPVKYEFNPWAQDSDKFWNTGPYTYLKGSPWEMVGASTSIKMDKQFPYAGEQSVKVMLAGNGSEAGIKQARLAVVGNKKYNGYVILSGQATAAPVTIRLTSPGGISLSYQIPEITPGYKSYPFEFTPAVSSDSVTLEIVSNGKGSFNIGTASLMPSDNIKGWRTDVVALLKELNSPVYRWPGGNFVSGYNWMDGIGERDKRPPRKNPAWKGVESNDVGIHEFMELMGLINAEPYVAVNTGLGTVEDVAKEIEYCNGSTESEMGKLRAKNGHPEPYKVKLWAVGNEMYGNWQLGHMPLEEYVKKHTQMAEAIWKIDPDAKLVGVGAVGDWSKTMLSQCADHINLLSEHLYCRELPNVEEHIAQIAKSIHDIAQAHRHYRDSIPGLREKNIRLALDEWNYWYGDYIYGELGVQYHQKDALGIARGLHEYFRNSDLFFMANYAQTVNVIGCIKTTKTTSGFATTGLPLVLYRNHFGSIPINLENNLPGLDISAALSPDKKKLTIAVVNSQAETKTVSFALNDLKVVNTGTKWVIENPNPEAYNEPGKEPNVKIAESAFDFKNKSMAVPGYSINMVSLDVK